MMLIGSQSLLQFSHLAWIQTDRKSGGLGDLQYPLISDVTKSISKSYGVLIPDQVWRYPDVLFCEASKIQNCNIIDSVITPLVPYFILPISSNFSTGHFLQFYSYYKMIFPLNYIAAPDILVIKVYFRSQAKHNSTSLKYVLSTKRPKDPIPPPPLLLNSKSTL